MASFSLPLPPLLRLRLSLRCPSAALTLVPFPSLPAPIASALRSEGVVKVKSQGSPDPALLRKPLASPPPQPTTTAAAEEREISGDGAADAVAVEGRRGRGGRRRKGKGEEEEEEGKWVDWEDLILQDTVPLVGFVRMILHSGKYGSGDRISPEHEKTIIERLLPYHPEYEKKIGCGIDYITIGFHPEFENSRCLFIARKDGELVDFSYWKCVKGLIRKNYPLYADSFILRHFRRRRDY